MPSGIFTLKQQDLALGLGAWTNQKPLAVDYLVVAGGGAGGGFYGAGGGAGGLLQGSLPVATGSALTVTVGGGGTGGSNAAGTNGSNSVFSSITATGGGFGPAGQAAGGSGGSGGGSGGNPPGRWGQGVAGQGNRGGDAGSGTGPAPGGGGGAGTRGLDGYGEGPAGNGGAGAAADISGTRTVYAGGGGGGTYLRGASGLNGLGGAGGGGAGGDSNGTNNGIAGTANTGGGGGGGSTGGGASSGGNGGSGIVIISYPDTYAAPASTTGSPTVSTSGSGSMFFNNPAGVSNQAITYATTSAQSLGAGDFCIEAFVWWSSSSGGAPYIATNFVGSNNFYWGLYQQGTIQFYVYGGVYLNAGSFTNNTWNHIVVCRTSGTTSMFLNGTRTATASDSVTYATGATSLYVGQNNSNTNMFNGYLSNFRIVVGNSIYNAAASSITVPTAPFAATSQTKVLLGTVSPNAYLESASSLTPTLVSNSGSVSWNQLSPFATGLGYKNRVYTWTSSGSITF